MKLRPFVSILVSACVTTGATAATTSTVVDIPSRNALQRILYVAPDTPIANIVSIPGGNGTYNIQDDGRLTGQGPCGPWGRNAEAFAERGIAIALVDKTSTGSVYNVIDILEVVRHVRGQHNVPTWIVGGSNATETVFLVANNLAGSGSLGGIVFTSPASLLPSQLASITRPTQVIYHNGDVGGHAAGTVYNGLTAASARDVVALTGGVNGSCGGAQGNGFHLFQGLDTQFVAAAGNFIQQNSPATGVTSRAVEFYNTALDHYFITHITDEIALLDAGTQIRGWARTGQSFNVYTAATTDTSPVCRFYIPPDKGDSHFYGRGTVECDGTAANNPSFVKEAASFFHVKLPVVGVCPAGTGPVYRVFSNRPDANHRYMVDRAVRDTMTGSGWLAEGDGADLVVMCTPP